MCFTSTGSAPRWKSTAERLFSAGGVGEFFRFAGETIRQDEKAGHPQTDENAEAFAVGAVFFRSSEPGQNRADDGDKAEVEADVREQSQILLVVTIADRFEVFFHIWCFHSVFSIECF